MEERSGSTTVEPEKPPQAKPQAAPPSSSFKLNAEQQAKVKAKLAEKGVNQPCPRCGNADFTLIDRGVSNPTLQDLAGSLIPISIPSVVTFCSRCGYLSLHALGILGFLDKDGRIEL